MEDNLRVLKLQLHGLHNLGLGDVYRVAELVLIQVEASLLVFEVVVPEVHNPRMVILTVIFFRVGKMLRLQMLLSHVLFWFVINQMPYYLIQALRIMMCPHIFL